MAKSKAKFKSSGDKASPCVRSFWTEKLSDKCLSTTLSKKYPTLGQEKKKVAYLRGLNS
jgi:hypothetical protein